MERLPRLQIRQLRQAILEHDFCKRILHHIENLHRLVFHNRRLKGEVVSACAREILIADIATGHGGDVHEIYFLLRKTEDGGKPWEWAIRNYATYTHNYYTTPLGTAMRENLFGRAGRLLVTPITRKAPVLDNRSTPRRPRVAHDDASRQDTPRRPLVGIA